MMVWLSVGLRAIVNVEALNMVESIGNIVRHRKAAIVYRRQDGSYVLRYVPAVSGESMAHAYQSWLVHLSKERKLPVCEFCEKEEFVKHAQPELFGKSKWEEDLKLSIEASKSKGKSKEEKESQKSQELSIIVEKIEEEIVRNCVVEDIGGFLFAGENPVKRTSRFYASYMVPSFDALDKSSLEPQMQVRHAPTASLLYKQAQMPYSVEVGSAVYSWSSMLDLGSIGICSYSTTKQAIKEDERINRIKLAIDALSLMLESRVFGAKRTRFNPLIEYESLLIAVSRNLPFTASPPSVRDYVARTVGRIKPLMNNFKYEFKLYGFSPEKDIADEMRSLGVDMADSITNAFKRAEEAVLEWLKSSAQSP